MTEMTREDLVKKVEGYIAKGWTKQGACEEVGTTYSAYNYAKKKLTADAVKDDEVFDVQDALSWSKLCKVYNSLYSYTVTAKAKGVTKTFNFWKELDAEMFRKYAGSLGLEVTVTRTLPLTEESLDFVKQKEWFQNWNPWTTEANWQ
jgi:hypothetical protein